MPKLTFLTRNILTFFLAMLICFGCGKPKVNLPNDSADQSSILRKSDRPGYYKRPRPELEIDRTDPVLVGKKRQAIVQAAKTAVGTPYFWGGLSPKGFDCSGLVVYTYAQIGIQVPRTASAQLENCTAVTQQNIKPADLIFFSVPRRRDVVHVGIYIGKGKFIHAPGKGRKVTLNSLDNVYFKEHFISAGNFLKKDAG